MKKFLLLCIAIWATSTVSAQVMAGVTTNMDYQLVNIKQQMLTNPVNNFSGFSDTLDLNGDQIADLRFESLLSNNPDFVGATIDVTILNPDLQVQYLTDSSYAQRLDLNDPILSTANWLNTYGSSIAFDFIGFAGPTSGGEWLNITQGYLGFRINESLVTRYGWIDIEAMASQDAFSLEVTGFAIEQIIDSATEVNIRQLPLFPNPIEDKCYLEIDGISLVRIIDLNGKILFEQAGNNINSIQLAGLPAGTFIIVAETDQGIYRNQLIKI